MLLHSQGMPDWQQIVEELPPMEAILSKLERWGPWSSSIPLPVLLGLQERRILPKLSSNPSGRHYLCWWLRHEVTHIPGPVKLLLRSFYPVKSIFRNLLSELCSSCQIQKRNDPIDILYEESWRRHVFCLKSRWLKYFWMLCMHYV